MKDKKNAGSASAARRVLGGSRWREYDLIAYTYHITYTARTIRMSLCGSLPNRNTCSPTA